MRNLTEVGSLDTGAVDGVDPAGARIPAVISLIILSTSLFASPSRSSGYT